MRSLVMWLIAGAVLFAGRGATMADDKKTAFTTAEVKYIRTSAGKVLNKTIKVEKAEAIEKLVKFFPTVGEKRKSDIAAAWKANVIVTLTDKNGKEHVVSSNFDDWSEGSGDWPIIGKGFEEHIVELFKE